MSYTPLFTNGASLDNSGDELTNASIVHEQAKDPLFQAVLSCQGHHHVDKVFKQLNELGAINPSHSSFRGVVGETAFHLCFLLMGQSEKGIFDGMSTALGSLAQKLLAAYEGFLDLAYEHPLYQGETALHLAVGHRDVTSVEWLLEKGARLDVYATGTFCQKLEWGEDPISWAACAENVGLLEMFMQTAKDRKFDESFITAQDTAGNTVLHNMAVASNLASIATFQKIYNVLHHGSKAVTGCFSIVNKAGMTPLQYAATTPLGASKALLQAAEVKLWRFAHVECNAHRLKGWDTLHTDPSTDGLVSALEVAAIHENHEFFSLDLNRLLIDFKWKKFAAGHIAKQYAFYFTVVLTGTVCASESEHSYRSSLCTRIVSLVILLVYVLRRTFIAQRLRSTFFYQKVKLRQKLYLVKAPQLMACSALLMGIACRLYLDWYNPGPIPMEDADTGLVWLYRSLLPIGVITSWGLLAEVLLLDKYLGGVILVVQEIITRDLIVWAMIQGILLVSFSVVLNFIYHGPLQNGEDVVEDFAGLAETLLSLLFAPVGHIVKMEALRETQHDTLVICLYFCYLVGSCVLTFNLTIALFTQRMSTVMESFEGRYQHMWSWIMIAVEKEMNPASIKEKRLGAPISDMDPEFYLVLESNLKDKVDDTEVERHSQIRRLSTNVMTG